MKSKTHIYMADLLIKDLENNRLVLPGLGIYAPPAEVRNAVIKHPSAFRAGSVGPDFYPDMLLGQAIIHPERSGEWLALMFKRLLVSPAAEREANLSFTLGYMTHYAGDMFGHTYVNSYAGGWFPAFTEIASNTEKAKIAARHMLVEAYMDLKVPKSALMTLSAPVNFIHDVFTCNEAQQLMKSFNADDTVPDPLGKFIKMRKSVHATLRDTAIGMLPLVTDYVQHWEEDVDTGIRTWLETWGRAADMFASDKEGKISYTQGILENWFLLKFTSMIGIPDFVGKAISFLNELDILKPLKDYIKNLLKTFLIALAKTLLGTAYTTLEDAGAAMEKVFKDPRTYLDNGLVFNEKNISQKLDKDFGNYGCEDNTAGQTFHAVYQCLNMSKLCLAGTGNLNGITKGGAYNNSDYAPASRIKSITVRTANKLYAGTDNNVYLGIRYNGAIYDTLCDIPGYNDFERGDTDTYSFTVPENVDLSKVDAITARMSGKTAGGDWDCDWIQIKDENGNVLLQSDEDFCLSTGRTEAITNIKRKYNIPAGTVHIDHKIMSFLWSLDGKGKDDSNPAKKKPWELGFNIYADSTLRNSVFKPLFETPCNPPSGKNIVGIFTRSGEIMDNVTFLYDNGEQTVIGGPGGGQSNTFALNGERIVSVSYTLCGYPYYSGCVCKLIFKTNKGRACTYSSTFYNPGRDDSATTVLTAPPGKYFSAFSGTAGKYLRSLAIAETKEL